MKVFLLTRKISPYSGFDLLLGAFIKREDAVKARKRFIEAMGREDPWGEQAYRKVNLSADVRISDKVRAVGVTEKSQRVWVISSFDDGFGQVFREFKAIHGKAVKAPPSVRPVVAELTLGKLVMPNAPWRPKR